jgi:predicted metal-dependent hydrolase
LGTKPGAVRRFVLERAGWIARVRRRFLQHVPSQPLLYRSGETHLYAGRQYQLEVKQGEKDRVTCLSGRLLVTSRHRPTEERTKKLLDAWYQTRAEILFHDRLSACQRIAAQEGIPLPVLRIRKMRTCWGSFSPRGRMTLNLLLIMAPVECLDYVILHELCHHKVGRHGPRFWGLLTRLMPDCKERKRELNSHAGTLCLP